MQDRQPTKADKADALYDKSSAANARENGDVMGKIKEMADMPR
jgi:hypothetical protein